MRKQVEQIIAIETHRQEQERQNEIRIIKEKTKIFACKRCSIKYSNNIQFHKHIDEYHIKKIKNIKFEIVTSITSTSSKSIFSIILNHESLNITSK